MNEPRYEIGHNTMTLCLKFALQMFLSTVINLYLVIDLFDLMFMLDLASLQLFDIGEKH